MLIAAAVAVVTITKTVISFAINYILNNERNGKGDRSGRRETGAVA